MNATGHMLVAKIAWDVMTPAARGWVSKLVANPNNPVSGKPTTDRNCDEFTAACYMDEIKPTMRTEHFYNHYIDTDGSIITRRDNAANSATSYDKNVAVLKDPRATTDEKAEALRYTMHVVGDLHIPAHLVSRVTPELPDGDKGGNSFPISWQGHLKKSNLHAYWDEAAGVFSYIDRPLDETGTQKLEALAQNIERQYPMAKFATQARDLDAEHWADEGVQMAIKDVYTGIKPNGTPSDAYKKKVQEDMKMEAALAGYRLGTLLNEVFAR